MKLENFSILSDDFLQRDKKGRNPTENAQNLMNKMLLGSTGDVTITNDGTTILKEIDVALEKLCERGNTDLTILHLLSGFWYLSNLQV